MVFIDGTAVNVALPALQANLHASWIDVQWIVESYALFLAALLLAGGALGDIFGRRKVFGLGVILFACASAACGLAADIRQLVLTRAVQGAGAALLTPGSLAILSASFEPQRRGRAIGTWSGFTAITAAAGPLLGGWLTEHASWRAVFFINPPLAALVLAITFWQVPESRDESTTGGMDWLGALLITIGLGGVVFGLIEWPRAGAGPAVPAAFVSGCGALIAFVLIESRATAPMLPLALFRSRSFSGANLLTLFLYAGLNGALFFVPLNMIQAQAYTASEAGAALLPFILLVFLLSRWSGGLVDRYGARLPLVVGPLIAGVGFALFALLPGGNYWTAFFPAILVLGLGMAIAVAPLTTVVMASARRDRAGIASGVNNAVSRVAALLGIAVLGIFVLADFNRNLDRELARLALPPGAWQQLQGERIKLAAAAAPEGLDPSRAQAVRHAILDSFLAGFRGAMWIAAALAVASSACAWVAIEKRKSARPGPW
jgi:EmrB/QacA subfamily drug resistance transporter